jgi:DNA-binding LacI/PurR family transcriptional regulator
MDDGEGGTMAKTTLTEIARHLDVNVGTVSRVLNDKAVQGRISDDLAERIRRAARKLGYVPNASAQATRTGRFNCVALLLSTIAGRSYLPHGLLDGLHDELARHNLHLTIAKVPDGELNNPAYVPKILRTLMADGLLINYTNNLPPHLVEAAVHGRIPAVWINTIRPADCVYTDNRDAAVRATEHLIQAGHRRIAYLDAGWIRDPKGDLHYSVRDRLDGYRHAMRTAGLEPIEFGYEIGQCSFDDEVGHARAWIRQPGRPTALLGYWHNALAGLVRAAWLEGLAIPRDLSIATFGGGAARGSALRVSTMVEPEYEVGLHATEMLLRKIARPRSKQPPRVLGFTWHDQGTCIPPSGS